MFHNCHKEKDRIWIWEFVLDFAKAPGIATVVKVSVKLLLQVFPTKLLPVINADKSDKRQEKLFKEKKK